MSNNTTDIVAGQTPEPKPQPVDLLTTPAARLYNQVHPALVLSIYFGSFSFTVTDPVTSLVYLLVPLAILQAAFCGVCVPPSSSDTTVGKASQPQRKKKSGSRYAELSSRLVPVTLSTILAFFVTSPPLFVFAVLHGAPVTSHIPHTLLLATHLSLLSCVPLFYAHGVSSSRWRTLYSLLAPVDELTGAAMGTIVGAWAGAIPIPLDWDREWQKWPVTVVTGAYLGWAVGRTLGGWSKIKGAHVSFD